MDKPPSYEQVIGPNFIPIGTPDDLAQAARIAGSSRIYAALRPTEDSVRKMANASLSMFALPCFWCSLPCLLPAVLNQKAALRNTLYVITEDSVFISVGDYSPPCSCGCTTGRNSCEISFENITDVIVDNRGQGCTCCRPPLVVLSMVTKRATLLVENTEGVAHLIRELRRASKDRFRAPAIMAQPIPLVQAPAAPQARRIFVAGSSNPAAFSIINLYGDSPTDWEAFLQAIRNTFGFPNKSEIRLTLADVNAAINGPGQLSSNDKIIANVY